MKKKLESGFTHMILTAALCFGVMGIIQNCKPKTAEASDRSLGPKILYTDTIVLNADQRGWHYFTDDPTRGRIRVELDNYHDSTMKVFVEIRELAE